MNKSYEDFTKLCDKKTCLRHTIYNEKTCLKEYKRKDCYKKWTNKQEKDSTKISEHMEQESNFVESVWIEKSGSFNGSSVKEDKWKSLCSIWMILTEEEKIYVELNWKDDLYHMQQSIDVAHIKPKGIYKKLKYDMKNVCLMGRFFHRRLTDLKHPVTGENITQDEADMWNVSALEKNRIEMENT